MASNQQQQQQQQQGSSRNGSRNGTPTIMRNITPTTARRSHSRSNSIIDDSLPIPSIDSFTVASPIALNKTLGIPFLKNKNINNRSNSASKAATQKIYETEASNRSTSAYRARSRRKERRLENDNMFGIGIKAWNDSELDDIDEYSYLDIKSGLFSDLFNEENLDILQLFRSCNETSYVTTSNVSKRPMRTDQWEQAESAWMKVEKKIRSVIPTILNNIEICLFVLSLETLLVYFIENQVVPPLHMIPRNLSNSLEYPISVSINNDQPFLTITLKESSFKRLLLHATCQFYGLKSKSFNDIKTGTRATLIATNKRKNNSITKPHCSLIKYLLCTMKNINEDDVNIKLDTALN